MGLLFVYLIVGLYIFVLIKAFYVSKPSEIVSIAYFETLKLNAKIIFVVSLLLLFAVLIIHGGVYWGFALFSSIFAFLGFLTPSSMDDRIEVYMEQVAFIVFIILLPYAKYSISVVKKFKAKLFDYMLKKYDSNIEIISKKTFSTIDNIVFADRNFLNRVKSELNDSGVRNSSRTNIDDTFYFPHKKIYITELTVETIREIYKVNSKGKGKWKTDDINIIFNGLVIVLPKTEYSLSSSTTQATLFSLSNPSSSISSEFNRSSKKHGIILDLYYRYFRGAEKLTYTSSNFSNENFNHFDKKALDYATQNKPLALIAQKMNVSNIMEDNNFIYIFHNEQNIDLFTFYQNEEVGVSLETFENDFKLLLEISKEFNLESELEEEMKGI